MLGLNTEQWFGLLRQILPVIGGIFVSLGWIKPATLQTWTDTAMQISGPTLIVISAVWSAIMKTKANIVATAATITDTNGNKIVENIKLAPTAEGREVEKATPTLPNVAVNPVVNKAL